MKVEIISKDSYEENYKKIFEIISKKEKFLEKTYEYKDEFGKSKIIVKQGVLEIYRNGIINSKQIMKLNKSTPFLYVTKDFKGKYEIFTKKLDIKNDEIIVFYDIIDRNELINSIELNIKFYV